MMKPRRDLYGALSVVGQPYSDPRLRGLSGGSVALHTAAGASQQAAASRSERAYSVMNPDPYAAAAIRDQELGHRLPIQYQAPSSLAGRPSLTGHRPSSGYENMYPDHSVFDSRSVAGQRQTQWGTSGTPMSDPYNWDARRQFGYGDMRSRDGYSQDWDTPANKERTAGRLSTTGSFDQAINPARPYLQLRARGDSTQAEGSFSGNALIRVTAGNFENGQGSQVREFWLGGGLVAAFDLMNWNNVRINILEIMDDTWVEFAWTSEGLHGGDRDLYKPEHYVASADVAAVPEGAYAVIIENPVPAVAGTTIDINWVGYIGGAAFTFTEQVSDNSAVAAPRPYAYFANPVRVKAPAFRIGTTVDLVWVLRPI
jgi:hypothetical protein